MKLRNKKTGKVQTCDMVVITDEKLDGAIASLNKHAFIFRSIEQFNDQYEAYKLAEPLIKDEKIRKVVRVWAEVNDVKKVTVEKDFSTYAFYPADTDRVSISIWTEPSLSNLSRGNVYTIEELCGEEEEK